MYGYYRQKHKVFISFYHYDDQQYKNYIDSYLSNNIINKSVSMGNIRQTIVMNILSA